MPSAAPKEGLASLQFLLKRNPENSPAEFRKNYLAHGKLAIPLFLADRVVEYSQLHHPLTWTSPAAEAQWPDIDLDEWDAVGELTIRGPTSFGKEYYKQIVLPDEERIFVKAALDHGKMVGAGSISGEKHVFMKDGKPVVKFEASKKKWVEVEGSEPEPVKK